MPPLGVIAILAGEDPTLIAGSGRLVAVSIGVTVPGMAVLTAYAITGTARVPLAARLVTVCGASDAAAIPAEASRIAVTIPSVVVRVSMCHVPRER